METYFELYYDENAKKREKKGEQDKQGQNARKFVFFEEKIAVIELELRLCGYFCIITSDKMTAKQALEIYKGRDASEKLFLSDKTFLVNHALRSSTEESAASKIFIEFVALIIRNRMYTKLKDEEEELLEKPNYMNVPASIRELEKIELIRQADGIYRLDHAVTATQKTILKAFGIDANYVKRKAREISDQLNPKVLKVRI
jgi:transposase